jgi:hypothetical protein
MKVHRKVAGTILVAGLYLPQLILFEELATGFMINLAAG